MNLHNCINLQEDNHVGRQNPISVTQLKFYFFQVIPCRFYFLCMMLNQRAFKIFLCVLWLYAVWTFFVWMTLREPPSAEMGSNIYPLISKAVLAERLLLKYKPEGDFFQLFLSFSIPVLHLIHFLTHPSPHLTPTSLPPPPFSVAQQPSVINELLQFDLICLRIGHVW